MTVVFARPSDHRTCLMHAAAQNRGWLLLAGSAASEIEPAGAQEWIATRAALADPRIGDGLVLELAGLDAFELVQLLRDDRDCRPCLHSRTDRLVQTSPESCERALVEPRRHQEVELEVVLERLALEPVAAELGVLEHGAD